MKFTLAFTIHNKQAWIGEYLRTWLDTLSGRHPVEVLAVFDDCHDASEPIVAEVMQDYHQTPYHAFVTDNIFEIRANNLMLRHASGDVIVYIQDDNTVHDPNWDDLLASMYTHPPVDPSVSPIGAVGLLAGVSMNKNFSLNRVETWRPHKDERAWVHGIDPSTYPPAIYSVDSINRPFAVPTALLRGYGGLDEAYCPMDWDDPDLSFKLLRDGYTNLYLPFDVFNLCGKKDTLPRHTIDENFQRGERIAKARWGQFIAERETSYRMLAPLTVTEEGLVRG